LSSIYIGGDSYCYYREDPAQHWPARLANQLGLELQGQGYPGSSWWLTRQHLLAYIRSDKFADTQYFVVCHTDHNRILTSNPIFQLGDNNSNERARADIARKVWYSDIQSDDVTYWCQQQWYQELDQLLVGRRVVHLPCFAPSPHSHGLVSTTPLLDLAVVSAGGQLNSWGSSTDVRQRMNQYANHLSPEYNIKLAHWLAQVLDNYQQHSLEIRL